MVNPCVKSIWKHACSHWACFPRMFTMAPRRVWEHNWFVMAHSQVYLYRCDGQLWLCLFYAASVSVLLLLPMSQCACVSVCLYLLLTMDLCVGMAVCLSVVFGCDCRGTMDVYFQKYFLWMKTKTWGCVLVDQIAGSYKRWMNADSLTDTNLRGCFILSFHHPHMTHCYLPILPLNRINLADTGYMLHYFY